MTQRGRFGWRLLAGLFLSVCMAMPAQADDAKPSPVAMSEINRMIEGDSSPQDVLKQMAERGVSFRVSSTAAKRLGKYGFTDDQIALIRKIAAGEEVSLDEPEAEAQEGEDAEAQEAGEFPVGYPMSAGFHSAEKQRIVRAVKAAGLGYKRIELSRCTLYCHSRRVGSLVPMLKKLEADLIKRFPKSIANAITPDSAHIVIVDGESEWRNWVTACFDSYEKDGMRHRFGPGDEDPRKSFAEFSSYFLRNLVAVHADRKRGPENISRIAAYGVGHLMMGKAGGKDVPDGLRAGFGSVTEVMAHRTPTVTVFSYSKRDIEAAENGWKALTVKRFKDKEITSISAPWNYKTSDMKLEHYAECWSYVSTLAAAPDKFAKAVGVVRESDTGMQTAVSDTYKLEDRKLLEAWYKHVSR